MHILREYLILSQMWCSLRAQIIYQQTKNNRTEHRDQNVTSPADREFVGVFQKSLHFVVGAVVIPTSLRLDFERKLLGGMGVDHRVGSDEMLSAVPPLRTLWVGALHPKKEQLRNVEAQQINEQIAGGHLVVIIILKEHRAKMDDLQQQNGKKQK